MSTEHAELASELETALELAEWACARIRLRPETIEAKQHPADHVTETDREVEQHVRSVLAERFPNHTVIGEEFGGDSVGGPTWYLDPVDGTTNYAHGLPWSSFSLALMDAGGAAVGVVADPYRDEVFDAVRGRQAECNGVPMQCSAAEQLDGQLVLTEWEEYRPWVGMEKALERLAEQYCPVRIMGSTALSLVSIAAGRAAACVIGTYYAIDGLAAAFIAEQAGAVCLAEDGTHTVFPEKGGLLVAAPGIAEAMLKIWQPEEAT